MFFIHFGQRFISLPPWCQRGCFFCFFGAEHRESAMFAWPRFVTWRRGIHLFSSSFFQFHELSCFFFPAFPPAPVPTTPAFGRVVVVVWAGRRGGMRRAGQAGRWTSASVCVWEFIKNRSTRKTLGQTRLLAWHAYGKTTELVTAAS